jgi:hypothetical protein
VERGSDLPCKGEGIGAVSLGLEAVVENYFSGPFGIRAGVSSVNVSHALSMSYGDLRRSVGDAFKSGRGSVELEFSLRHLAVESRIRKILTHRTSHGTTRRESDSERV